MNRRLHLFAIFKNIRLKDVMIRLLRMFAAMYLTLFFLQRFFIFPAYMADLGGKLQPPEAYGLAGFSEVSLTTSDHVHVMGWSHAAPNNMPIILYFHGNAMHIAARIPRFKAFANAGYGVFALSYRGYGKSEGSPSEQGLYADARAAIDWLEHHYDHPRIILYGESLGSGVAVEMAKEYKVTGLVLQSAYTSIADVAAETYWFLPGVHYLVRDPFDSLSKIAQVHCPVLIVHGDMDSVIPYAHGKKLADKANEPKRFITVHGAGHMNIPDSVLVDAMTHFFTANP